MHAVAAFFASIITFGSGFLVPPVASNSPVNVRMTQPAAVVAAQSEIANNPFNDPAAAPASLPPPALTVINQPGIERIVEKPVPQHRTDAVSPLTLATVLATVRQELVSRINGITAINATSSIPQQIAAAGYPLASNFLPASQRIDALANVTITNPVIVGGSISGTSGVGGSSGAAAWGGITGTLANQTDLQNALNGKLSLASWYATSTTALAEGSNLYFTSARADQRINATSTIGTLTSAPNLATVATSFTGFLKATAGVLSTAVVNLASDVSGILPVTNGGTGWAALASGAIPYGNGSSALSTTTAGTAGQVLAYLNGVPTWTATTTFAAPLSYSNGSVSLAQANGSTNGYLASGDWSLFNNKISSSSLSAIFPLSYNSATGQFTTAFSTSTANSFSQLQQFNVGATSTALTVSGATWLTGVAASSLLALDSNRQIVATTSISTNLLSGILGIANGGTATSTQVTNGVSYFDGTRITSGTGLAFDGANLGVGTTTPGARLVVQGAAGTSAFSIASSTGASMLTVNADGSLSAKLKQLTADYAVDSGSASINVGDLVSYINGNVKKAVVTVGTPVAANAVDSTVESAVTLDATHFVLAYRGPSTTYYAYAVIGTVSGTTITFGAPVALNAVSSTYVSATALDSTHFVVAYEGASSYPNAVVSTVSGGTTITPGTPVVLSSGTAAAYTSVAALDATHFATTYAVTANNTPYAIVSTVSGGTTITPGTQVQLANSITYTTSVAALDSTHFVTAFGNNYPYAVVSTVSGGTTITPGAYTALASTQSSVPGTIAALDSTHFVVPYTSGSSGPPAAVVSSVSGGTTITPGTPVILQPGIAAGYVSAAALDSTHFVVTYENASVAPYSAMAVIGTVTGGTNITNGGPLTLNAVSSTYVSATALDSTHFVVGYENVTNTRAEAVAAQPLLPNVLGMATNAASAGGTVTVASNGIVGGLSGLTPGAQYYYGLSTGVTTTPQSYRVGTSISTTSILLNSGAGAGPDQFFGDAVFANGFRITENPFTPQSLMFKNQLGRQIADLDENGNFWLAGTISASLSNSILSALLGDATAATSTSGATSSLTDFLQGLFARLTQWFADASNGIHDLYVGIIHSQENYTQKLCITDGASDNAPLCVTKSQLEELMIATGQTSTPASTSTTSVLIIAPVSSTTPANDNVTSTGTAIGI